MEIHTPDQIVSFCEELTIISKEVGLNSKTEILLLYKLNDPIVKEILSESASGKSADSILIVTAKEYFVDCIESGNKINLLEYGNRVLDKIKDKSSSLYYNVMLILPQLMCPLDHRDDHNRTTVLINHVVKERALELLNDL